jgi:hypothetical protein
MKDTADNGTHHTRWASIVHLVIITAIVIMLVVQGVQTFPRLTNSALYTIDSLPFSYAKQLRRTYGSFYDLVMTGTDGIPKYLEPRIRSGARIMTGEAEQVRQKFPHHGSVPTDDLYLILCHGISGYTIKRDYINAQYPIHNQTQRTSDVSVPAETPLTFAFTTGIDVDTLESIVIVARALTGTTCRVALMDSKHPETVMAETTAQIGAQPVTKLSFDTPVQLLYRHGATPYLLRFTFSNNARVAVSKTTRPDQRVTIGDRVVRDVELTGSIVGRLVDAREYTLMQSPVRDGFIFGRTAVLNELDIEPPYTSDDIAAVGSYALTHAQRGNAE